MPVGQFRALALYSENTRSACDNGGIEIRSANLDSNLKDLKIMPTAASISTSVPKPRPDIESTSYTDAHKAVIVSEN